MKNYFIKYRDSKVVSIIKEEEEIFRITYGYNWRQLRLYCKGHINGQIVLEYAYSNIPFSKAIIIIKNNTGQRIEFIKKNGKYCLKYNEDYYWFCRNSRNRILPKLNRPWFIFFKNDIEIGNLYLQKKVLVGGGILFRMEFYEEAEPNLFQLMFFVSNDLRGNRST